MTLNSELVGAFVTGVVGPLAVQGIKYYLDHRKAKKADLIKEACSINRDVEDKIEKIRVDFEADRVWISQIHNGGHFLPTGKSIQKFSMFYEVVDIEIPSIKYKFQNIPLSLFTRSTDQLIKNDILIIPSFEDSVYEKYGLGDVSAISGCKSTDLFALKDLYGRYFGTFGLEYTKKEVLLEEKDIQEISRLASVIGGVLMINYHE
jgi:hypothetical protein